jgi:hypothetical protein
MASLFHNNTDKDHIKSNYADVRTITFKLIDDQKPRSSTGLSDPRLYQGGNKLYATRGDDFLWYVKYEKGAIPPALNQKWTHYQRMLTDVEAYFNTRNVAIKQIED